jgi:hypothetical protein
MLMLDPATVAIIVPLFKEIIEFFKGRGAKRRDMFERTFKPLYEALEPVAKDYHGIVRKAALQLEKRNPDLVSIVHEVQAERAGLIMARQGLLGEADAFIKDFGNNNERTSKAFERIRRKGELEGLALAFAQAIVAYFCSEEFGGHAREPHLTKMSGLVRLVEDAIASGHSENLERQAQYLCRHLEETWRTVGERYASLKWFCERG